MLKLKHYFAVRNLKLNLEKCKIVKFRREAFPATRNLLLMANKLNLLTVFVT